MKSIVALSLFLFLIACANEKKEDQKEEKKKVEETKPNFKVEHAGALKNMMHKGDLSAYADLNDFKEEPHLYALGAVENLKGEILILDGVPHISSDQNDTLKIDNSFDYKASLFVYSSVSEWTEIEFSNNIQSYEDFEIFVAQAAKQNGIDLSKPFPFLLKGMADSLNWHVINWPEGDTEHSHEKHIQSGLHGTHLNTEVEILGFYSDSHHAIFTHHTTNMHLHFISEDKSKTGHVDGLVLGKGMKLYLPK